MSHHESVFGSFISISPGCSALNIKHFKHTLLHIVSCDHPQYILDNMYTYAPSHCNFLDLIHFSRSNLLSSLVVLSVITLIILAFTPFRTSHTSVVSRHASETYVSIVWYTCSAHTVAWVYYHVTFCSPISMSYFYPLFSQAFDRDRPLHQSNRRPKHGVGKLIECNNNNNSWSWLN